MSYGYTFHVVKTRGRLVCFCKRLCSLAEVIDRKNASGFCEPDHLWQSIIFLSTCDSSSRQFLALVWRSTVAAGWSKTVHVEV
uniref:Uncharacterized protein n=1 Tax=Setaria italica TaxID=4555 RepID=K3XNV1_SETIT